MKRAIVGPHQPDQLLKPSVEKQVWHHDQCASLTLDHGREGCLKIGFSASCQHLQASPESVGRRFGLRCISRDVRIAGVNKQRDRLAEGSSSRRSSKRFGPRILVKTLTPVRLPPGRLKLSTRPVLTGSAPVTNTIGMVLVAAFAAADAGASRATITATPRLTSSPASEVNGCIDPQPSAIRCLCCYPR